MIRRKIIKYLLTRTKSHMVKNEQQEQQTELPTSPKGQPESLEVDTCSLSVNYSASAAHAPLPRGSATAESTLDPQSSAPASAIELIKANDNNNIDIDEAPGLAVSPNFLDCLSHSGSCKTQHKPAALPTSTFHPQHSAPSSSASINQNPASNFPFRPLNRQTLLAEAEHGRLTATATAKQQSSPRSFHLPSPPSTQLDSDDIGIVMQRKVWVKRPGASATRVEVADDDLVDNVRDMILHKYANSLGRHIDSPDITLKIVSREQTNKNVATERPLGPEESIGKTLDTYYPGGQTIDEALLIEVALKKTPKPSPRPGNHHIQYYLPDDYRPGDGARDYFPPMPLQSPRVAHGQHPGGPNGNLPVHSMSVITTGQIPALPSPGGQHARARPPRPRYQRQHTSSPTIVHSSQTNGIDTKAQINGVATVTQPLPTPPPAPGDKNNIPIPNRTTSPHSRKRDKKRQGPLGRDINSEPLLPSQPASAGLLDGRVPPINVLLVEDNPINLKLLEQFMKRLRVRWKSAVNGKEAVNMWRKGGFHLVLMDIQLPVMNGLEATKEIRRLESVNGIGLSVFGEMTADGKGNGNGQLTEEDTLEDRGLFKSPVIIVALTASSLQSDRHEALAVGCNDFLTKPVNFVWMERKVTEWGCMQALIDFDGWRRWKAIAEKKESEDPKKRKQDEEEEKAKAKAALKNLFSRPPPTTKKEASIDSSAKKEDSVTAPPTLSPGSSTSTTDQSLPRRAHKGSRSQSGNSLGTTIEVEEKEG